MIKIANMILVTFIRICGASYKILHGNKFTIYVKAAAFSGDGGIANVLEKLTRPEEMEKQMKGTLNLVTGEITKRCVAQIAEEFADTNRNLRNMQNDLESDKILNQVSRLLGSPRDTYRADHARYLSWSVPTTGDWIRHESKFNHWSNERSQPSLLALSAEEGFGKTHAMSFVVRELEKRFPQGRENGDRVSVAYFYMKKGG